MRSGTTRAQQRIMAKSFSARSGIDAFPLNLMDRWAEPSKARRCGAAVFFFFRSFPLFALFFFSFVFSCLVIWVRSIRHHPRIKAVRWRAPERLSKKGPASGAGLKVDRVRHLKAPVSPSP